MSTANDLDQIPSEEAEGPLEEIHKDFEEVTSVNKTFQIACDCNNVFILRGCKLDFSLQQVNSFIYLFIYLFSRKINWSNSLPYVQICSAWFQFRRYLCLFHGLIYI